MVLGFDTIRTGPRIFAHPASLLIESLDLDLKLQAGIYITNNDAEALIDRTLSLIEPYRENVLGISAKNEQLADWNLSALSVSMVHEHGHLRNSTDLPVTYNFAGETCGLMALESTRS